MWVWTRCVIQAPTCKIFIRTTSSLARSVPTNLACVTASAMFSIPLAAHGDDMSMRPYDRNLLIDESATPVRIWVCD